MRIHRIGIGLVIGFLAGCTPKYKPVQEQSLFQVSTIDALLQGDYDGYTSLKELSSKGDFGIGTVNALDGELVIENGQFYQVKADGKVYRPFRRTENSFCINCQICT